MEGGVYSPFGGSVYFGVVKTARWQSVISAGVLIRLLETRIDLYFFQKFHRIYSYFTSFTTSLQTFPFNFRRICQHVQCTMYNVQCTWMMKFPVTCLVFDGSKTRVGRARHDRVDVLKKWSLCGWRWSSASCYDNRRAGQVIIPDHCTESVLAGEFSPKILAGKI